LRDAQGILSVLEEKLDVAYIEKWAKDLGIKDSIQRLLAEPKLPNLET